MENLQNLQKYSSLESFALDQTEEFLRPKTPLDYIFTLVLIFWSIIAVVFTDSYTIRAVLFGITVILFFFIPFTKYFSQDIRDIPSPLNRAVKILMAFHDKVYSLYAGYLNGDAQLLMKLKPFWEYYSHHFSNARKVYKGVKKANSIDKYHQAVGMAFNEFGVKESD